jgi:CRP-like cAMP-binding protein
MNRTHFAEGEVLFKEGDPSDYVFRLVTGAVEIFRELDGERILLGTVGAGEFIGEMGVVENRPRSATAQAASNIEVEILSSALFFDQIAGRPQTARELISRLSQRLREADDRIVKDERRRARAHMTHTDRDSQTILTP